jgi:hypothetical protein
MVMPMADYGRELPHDLAHLVVESMLDLPFGFWGLMAQGASFETLHRAAAGSSPVRRTDPIIEEHLAQLLTAEGLVTLFRSREVGGAAGDADYVARAQELCERHGTDVPPRLDEQRVARIRDALDEVNGRWQFLAHGDALRLEFPVVTDE